MKQRLRVAFATLFDPPLLAPRRADRGAGRRRARGCSRRSIDRARRRGAVVLASNDERDFAAPESRIELGGAREPGAMSLPAQAWAVARRTPPRSCGGGSRSWRSSSSRPRRSRWCRSRSGPSACPRRTGLRSRPRFSGSSSSSPPPPACPGLRSGGGDRHRARAAQDPAGALSSSPGKTIFNLLLFLAIAAVDDSRLPDPARLEGRLARGASPRPCWPAATDSRSCRRFSRRSRPAPGSATCSSSSIAFPLLVPLLLTAIAGTLEATRGDFPGRRCASDRVRWGRDVGSVPAGRGRLGGLTRNPAPHPEPR